MLGSLFKYQGLRTPLKMSNRLTYHQFGMVLLGVQLSSLLALCVDPIKR